MARDGYLSVRIDKNLKDEVHQIFSDLGLSSGDVLTMFYSMIKQHRGIPFEICLPKPETRQAMKDAEEGRNLKTHNSMEEMFAEWDLEAKKLSE